MTSGISSCCGAAARAFLILLFFVIPFSNAAVEILFPLLFFSWLIGRRFLAEKAAEGRLGFPSRKMVLWSLAFYLAACALSLLTSNNKTLSVIGLVCKTFEYALFFFMASDISQDLSVFRKGIQALLWAAGLVLLYAFFQEWLIHRHSWSGIPAFDPIIPRKLIYIRMVGPYSNPNDLATFLMVVSLIVLSFLFSAAENKAAWRWGLFASLLLGCLAWTHSRGALMGFTGGLAILLLVYGKHQRTWIIGSLGLAAVTALLILRKGHLLQLLSFTDAGSKERVIMWEVAWRMIQAQPLTGVGLNTFMFNYAHYSADPTLWPAYAHNCFLQVAAETGFVGLVTFLVFLFCLFYACWRALSLKKEAVDPRLTSMFVGTVAAMAGFLVQSAVDTNLYALRQAALFWTLSGAVVGASFAITRKIYSDA